MKAIRIHAYGGPDVLTLEDLPIPEPQDREILLRVHASSVNPVDYKIRSGAYTGGDTSKLPVAVGRDVSGVIESCGPEVAGWQPGDAVYALLGHGRGGHAEYVILKEEEAAAKPANLDHDTAAAVPLAGLTAWQGLFDHGGLQAGQRVLIHGGAGGVGHFAVQFAKARGAWVATTVSKDDIDFARELGADTVIDYRNERFEDAVDDINLVFDLVGGQTQDRSWDVLQPNGMLVSTVAAPSEEEARKRGARGTRYMAKPNAAQLTEITRLIEAGTVKPFVTATYSLTEAAAAEERLETSHNRGKIVLHAG